MPTDLSISSPLGGSVAISYFKSDLEQLLNTKENENDGFIGLAFGKKIIVFYDEEVKLNSPLEENNQPDGFFFKEEDATLLSFVFLDEGLVFPFYPTVFAIYRTMINESSNIYNYTWEIVHLRRDRLFSEVGPNNGTLKNEVTNERTLVNLPKLQFSGHGTFQNFSFAFFPTPELRNVLAFSASRVLLSGTKINFGLGYHSYSSGSQNLGETTEYFTLKIEADQPTNFTIDIDPLNSSGGNSLSNNWSWSIPDPNRISTARTSNTTDQPTGETTESTRRADSQSTNEENNSNSEASSSVESTAAQGSTTGEPEFYPWCTLPSTLENPLDYFYYLIYNTLKFK